MNEDELFVFFVLVLEWNEMIEQPFSSCDVDVNTISQMEEKHAIGMQLELRERVDLLLETHSTIVIREHISICNLYHTPNISTYRHHVTHPAPSSTIEPTIRKAGIGARRLSSSGMVVTEPRTAGN